MPNSTREWARREHEKSIGNIDWAHTHLLRVADTYSPTHPEIAAPLLTIVNILEEVQGMLRTSKNSF